MQRLHPISVCISRLQHSIDPCRCREPSPPPLPLSTTSNNHHQPPPTVEIDFYSWNRLLLGISGGLLDHKFNQTTPKTLTCYQANCTRGDDIATVRIPKCSGADCSEEKPIREAEGVWSVCLGVLNGTEVGLQNSNITGDISTQDKMVIYDKGKQTVGWLPANCDRLLRVQSD
ncbi:hypothetical protein L6452_13831 [Arctium lappa]|uniref:Uncharacterized protein n=1 Tax=Arctium lappa TaxID=4217 RepID=A0ACB9CJ76_ARCLA|nr:hypothetical protein L6452_13831 [Arctium lappa]